MREAQSYLDDMLRMQENAKRRVQTQEQFARETVDRMNGEQPASVSQARRREEATPAAGAVPDTPPAKENAGEGSVLPLAGGGKDQTERMFILALCMLLSAEGADDALILSLMYLAS